MVKLLRFLENKWIRELLLFTLLFFLTIINDREDIINSHDFRDGFFIFLILYIHIQCQRFVVLPYLTSKRYLLYTILTIIVILLFSTGAYFIDSWLTSVGWYDDMINHLELYLYYVVACVLSLPVLLLVFFTVAFYKQQKMEADNSILLKEMELSLLRTQLNPHFLFNSLNNLYGVSLEKPAEVPAMIMQMARIMRYHLELSKHTYVSLQEDMDFITDYIAVESDRVSERCQVKLIRINLTDKLNDYKIAPMILVSFIENAFKHFGVPVNETNGFINLNISLDGSTLHLHILNSVTPERNRKDSTRLGLLNTRKRLGILYPDSYTLNITDDLAFYELSLKVTLQKVI